MTTSYCVIRKSNRNGGESTIARCIETLNDAGELAFRLAALQDELGGADEFIAQPE